MAFYYIRNNGVFVGAATGDAGRETTARTGVWDTNTLNSYPSIKSIFADQSTTGNTPVDGDVIVLADDHMETYATDVQLQMQSATSGNYLIAISSDTANQENYKRGAKVLSTSGADIWLCSRMSLKNNLIFKGVTFHANGHCDVYARESVVVFDNSDLINDDTWSFASAYQNDIRFINGSTFETHDIRTTVSLSFNDSIVTFNNGSYGLRDTVRTLFFNNCDLSASSCGSLCSYNSSAKLYNCKIPSSILDGSWFAAYHSGAFLHMISCGVADDYYNEVYANNAGLQTESTSVYLNYVYDGVSKTSKKIESTSKTSKASTFRYKLCELPAQDLSVTDKTYRVNLLLDTDTAATLSDTNFWVELSHSNNIDLALGDIVTSRNADILATGTELTLSAETWQGTLPTNTKAYQVDITLTAAQLINVTNSNVSIYVNLAVPNADVYVCPVVQIGT